MSSISFEKAEEIAEERVKQNGDTAKIECIINHKSTKTVKEGWIFFYTSKLYIETGDIQWAIGGNGPILVTKIGSVIELPTHTPWADTVEKLRADPEFKKLGEI